MLYVEILYRKNGEKKFTEKMGKKNLQKIWEKKNHKAPTRIEITKYY